jgi:hypothetical protein
MDYQKYLKMNTDHIIVNQKREWVKPEIKAVLPIKKTYGESSQPYSEAGAWPTDTRSYQVGS